MSPVVMLASGIDPIISVSSFTDICLGFHIMRLSLLLLPEPLRFAKDIFLHTCIVKTTLNIKSIQRQCISYLQ